MDRKRVVKIWEKEGAKWEEGGFCSCTIKIIASASTILTRQYTHDESFKLL
jgi:hypothetical protein